MNNRFQVKTLATSAFCMAISAALSFPAVVQAQVLEEITVTAERRETTLQDTPISILSFSGDTLQQMDTQDVREMGDFLPNVAIGEGVEGGNIPLFMIRGIGATGGSSNTERGVALYIDDVYFPRAQGSLFKLMDVERLEVLRGPQGTLFGRNTTGGAMRYITRKPHEDFEAEVRVALGTEGRENVTGTLNVPFSETVMGRFQIGSFHEDAYVHGISNNPLEPTLPDGGEADDTAFIGKLRFVPSDVVTVDLGFSYSDSETSGPANDVLANIAPFPGTFQIGALHAMITAVPDGQSSVTALQPPGSFATPRPAWTPDDFAALDAFLLNGPYTFTNDCYISAVDPALIPGNESGLTSITDQCSRVGDDAQVQTTSLDISWDINSDVTLRSITGLLSNEYEGGVAWGGYGTFVGYREIDSDVFSQEFQLTGASESLDWVAGTFYYTEDAEEFQNNLQVGYAPAGPVAGRALGYGGQTRFTELETNSWGVFGQLTWALNDAWNVTAGLRYSNDDKEGSSRRADRWNQNTAPAAVVVGTVADLPPEGDTFSADESWDSWDYRFTVDYSITDDVMLFATYSKAYKSGGININLEDEPAAFPTIDPPITNDPAGHNGGVSVFDPEEVNNIELGLRSDFLDGRARLNLTLFNMDYTDMQLSTPIAAALPGRAPFVSITNAAEVDISGAELEFMLAVTDNLTLNANVGTTDAEIQELDNAVAGAVLEVGGTIAKAPELSYAVGVDYAKTLANDGEIVFTGVLGYTDEQETSNSLSNSWIQPDYTVINSRIQYNSASDKWSAAIFCNNCADEVYYTGGANYSTFFHTNVANVGRPREWVGEFTYRF